jgi:hypothetical protein
MIGSEHLGGRRIAIGLVDAEQIELHLSSFTAGETGCLHRLYERRRPDRQPPPDEMR